MSTPTAVLPGQTEVPNIAEPAAQAANLVRWRLVRMVAGAHLVAGAVLALSVVANLALRLDYSGGPMGVYGSESIGLASAFQSMTQLRAWDFSEFMGMIGRTSFAYSRHAQTNPEFFGLMAAGHLGLAGLLAGVGYGLRRGLPWSLKADRVVIGVVAAVAATHAVVLLASGFRYRSEGAQILTLVAAIAGPILILVGSSRTSALFDPLKAPELRRAGRRRWWTLSADWLGAGLVVIFALGLVRLLFVGPLIELVWATIRIT